MQTYVPYPVRKLIADQKSNENISELNRMVLMVANTMVWWSTEQSQLRNRP